jgi:alpha-ketoglutarate-dependent taurine dioxygenase
MDLNAADSGWEGAVVPRFLRDHEYTEPSALRQLPQVVEASRERSLEFLISCCLANRDAIRQARDRYGAVLFRGFAVATPEAFRDVLKAAGVDLDPVFDLEPQARKRLAAGVFESSAYKSSWLAIMPHTEMVYSARRPSTVAFWCALAPATHGETPLSDFGAVYEALPPGMRRRLETRPLRVIRQLPPGYLRAKYPGESSRGWDRDRVEQACRRAGYTVRWRKSGVSAEAVLPAVVMHPRTGKRALNHQFFSGRMRHVFLAETWRRYPHRPRPQWMGRLWKLRPATWAIMKAFDGMRSPSAAPTPHLEFADGGDWSPEEMCTLARLVWDNSVFYRWRQGDVVLVDNLRIAHSRMPCDGPRKVAAAVGDMVDVLAQAPRQGSRGEKETPPPRGSGTGVQGPAPGV